VFATLGSGYKLEATWITDHKRIGNENLKNTKRGNKKLTKYIEMDINAYNTIEIAVKCIFKVYAFGIVDIDFYLVYVWLNSIGLTLIKGKTQGNL
jgi:hypothetical protein